MKTAKLFTRGKYQFARLPAEFRFVGKTVCVKRIGNTVALLPCQNTWGVMLDSLSMFSEDFMEERSQPDIQKRKEGEINFAVRKT
jgi:antitoxin VapB